MSIKFFDKPKTSNLYNKQDNFNDDSFILYDNIKTLTTTPNYGFYFFFDFINFYSIIFFKFK